MKFVRFAFVILMMTTFHLPVFAQSGYTLSTKSEAYVELTGDSVISPSFPWGFIPIELPVGFNYKIGAHTLDTLHIFSSSNLISTSLTGIASGFHITDGNLCDKAFMAVSPSGNPISTISYTLTGTTGSRILKVQFKNVGFFEEFAQLGTADDSANIQVWIYEGTNVIEMRYGQSKVSNLYGIYQAMGSMAGFLRDVDLAIQTPTFDKFYYVAGTKPAYILDSITSTTIADASPATIFPPDGTVYTFSPRKDTVTGIAQTSKVESSIIVYPTSFDDALFIKDKQNKNIDYSITNIKGQVIASGKTTAGNTTIDTRSWTTGMYILKADDGVVSYYKLYKQ